MRYILLLLLVLFCWTTVFAQDEAPSGDAPVDESAVSEESAEIEPPEAVESTNTLIFKDYISEDFGLTIPIPTIGELHVPGDIGWRQEPEVVFVWKGDKTSPVSMIELRADNIGSTITHDQYAHFYDKLVSEWESKPKKFTVTKSRLDPFHFGEMDWLIIEVEDRSGVSEDAGSTEEDSTGAAQSVSETVYYTIFTTYQDEVFYTIGFYYLKPVSDAVQELAVPMMRGFKLVPTEE